MFYWCGFSFIGCIQCKDVCINSIWADWCTSSMHDTTAKIGHMCSMKKWFKIQRKMEIICAQWSSWMGPSSPAMAYVIYVGTVWGRTCGCLDHANQLSTNCCGHSILLPSTSLCYIIWVVQNYGYLATHASFLIMHLIVTFSLVLSTSANNSKFV
jgi:hypothetical protein